MGCPDCAALSEKVTIQGNEITLLRKWKEKALVQLAVTEKVEEAIPEIEKSLGEINDMIETHIDGKFDEIRKRGIALLIGASLTLTGAIKFGPGFIDVLKALLFG